MILHIHKIMHEKLNILSLIFKLLILKFILQNF
jgi:hypothetical protein